MRGSEPTAPARLAPIFRDREELSTAGSLSLAICHALDQSQALIVVCSPAAAASRWVNEEIAYFRRQHPERPIFAFVVDGDPGLDSRRAADRAALPVNLVLADLDAPEGELAEPIAADARPAGDGFSSAALKLIAGLLGVGYDQLRRREQRRRQRMWTFGLASSLLLTLIFAALAWQATVARDQARSARAAAELELASERQTRGFLLSVFHLADASEARGSQITVREVLDRAAARIDETPFDRPVIKSRYLAMLGRAYSSLGLNRRASELLQHSIGALGDALAEPESWNQFVDCQIELADLAFDMGDYPAATAALDHLQARASALGKSVNPEQSARASNVRGDVLSYLQHDDAARAAYRAALDSLPAAGLEPRIEASARGHSLYGLAQLSMFAGDHDEAERRFAEASVLFSKALGNLHPQTITLMTTRGANAYEGGDKDTARQSWTAALAAAETVYDADSPQIGTLNNNLGRLELEAGNLETAEVLVRAALASDRKHRSAEFDDLAFPLTNLAIIRFARGDSGEALSLLSEALPIAEASNHRMLGAIQNLLGDLRCTAGAAQEGLDLAMRAAADARKRHGETDWRVRQAEITQRYCEHLLGQTIDTSALAAVNTAIRRAVGEHSPFSRRADEQLKLSRVPVGHNP